MKDKYPWAVATHAFTAESAARRAFPGVAETGCFRHSVQGSIHSGPGKVHLTAPARGREQLLPKGTKARGFTLLEIVVALAIAALGIAAVAKATGSAATVAADTRQRMLAVWVAGNRLSELKITRAWPAPGNHDVIRTLGGRTWYLNQVVGDTGEEAIRRVAIEVYTDPRLERREFTVHGYIGQFQVQSDSPGDGEDGGDGGGPGAALPDANPGVPLPGDEPPAADDGDGGGDGEAGQ